MPNFELANRGGNKLRAAALAGGLAISGLLVWAGGERGTLEQGPKPCPEENYLLEPHGAVTTVMSPRVSINVEDLGKVQANDTRKLERGSKIRLYDRDPHRADSSEAEPYRQPQGVGNWAANGITVEDKDSDQYFVYLHREANGFSEVKICYDSSMTKSEVDSAFK